MTTLRDLVFKVGDAPVIHAVALLYHQGETEWLPEAIADVLSQLRKLPPDSAASDFELHIDLTSSIEPNEPSYWDVCCTKQNDPERYGLDLSRWEEWLAVDVTQSLQDAMPAAEIVAHCIWEMTFYGFTQERIAETRAELDRRMREIDEGKTEFIPMEQVTDKLRAKLGWSDDDSGGAGEKSGENET